MTACVLLLAFCIQQSEAIQAEVNGRLWYQRGLEAREGLTTQWEATTAFRRAAQELESIGSSPDDWLWAGNARYLAGELPEAIAAYLCGLQLKPDDHRLRIALEFSRSKVIPSNPEVSARTAPRASPWPQALTLETLSVPAFVAWLLGCLSVTRFAMIWQQRWLYLGVGLIALAAIPALGSLLAGLSRWEERDQVHLVVARPTELRSGNGVDYPSKLPAPLPAGCELRRRFSTERWTQVQLADGTLGWIARDDAIPVRLTRSADRKTHGKTSPSSP